jgi:Circadian oscillating protein COP23
MKFAFTAQVLVAALTFFSTITVTTKSQALPSVGSSTGSSSTPSTGATSFQCITFGSGYATIAVAGIKKTNPLITYNNPVFSGSGYTPQERCQQISGRFQTAVANNGGKLRSLLLTVGEVGGYDVICYVNNSQAGCNKKNLLITLPPGTDSGAFLATFLKVSADPFVSANPARNSEPRTYIPFGEAVERELESTVGANENQNENQIPDNGGNVNPSNGGNNDI